MPQNESKVIDLIKKEEDRQQNTLMMIPSENYTFPEVRQAVGSVLMHKYSEGQIGARYYQGNEFIDEIESYCKELIYDVFGIVKKDWGVNVQAHSGSPANLAVFNALLKPGDRILSLNLPDGGHLSHGWHMGIRKITHVSKIYDVHFYSVEPKTHQIDYVKLAKLVEKLKPKIIVTGGTAYPREIDYHKVSPIAKSVGAYYLADVAHEAGLIAAKALKSPLPFADVVTFTTHKTLRGPRGAVIISRKELSKAIDSAVFPGLQGGPHNEKIAGIAIALEKTMTADFRNYAFATINNAQNLSKKLIEYGFDIVSGGTDKHLVLIDLRSKKINGYILAHALEHVGIIANMNTIPNDPMPPRYPSGLRLGAPAVTVRGFKFREMYIVAKVINDICDHIGELQISRDEGIRKSQIAKFKRSLKAKFYKKQADIVSELCKKYPIEF